MATATLEHRDITLRCHGPEECSGRPCPLHNRSDHAMRSFRQHWRDDRGLMERICPHGIGHPDPDTWDYYVEHHGERYASAEFIHGCDGCCRGTRTAVVPLPQPEDEDLSMLTPVGGVLLWG